MCLCTPTSETKYISLGCDKSRQVTFCGTDRFKPIIGEKFLDSFRSCSLCIRYSICTTCAREMLFFLFGSLLFTFQGYFYQYVMDQRYLYIFIFLSSLFPVPPCSFFSPVRPFHIRRGQRLHTQHNHERYSAQEHTEMRG